MMLNNYICALDIGSSKLSAAVARIGKGSITELFLESESSRGVRDGTVVDAIELIASVGSLLKKLQNISGIKIKSVYGNISGQDILTKHARAIIPLAEKGNKVITLADLRKVNEQARILGSSLEEEILHQIPFSYTIDSKGDIINPLGLYSHRLEVDLYLVCAKVSSVQSLSRVVNQAGYGLKDLFVSGIASSHAVFNHESKDKNFVYCDIGSDITEILFFKEGALKGLEVLRLGGNAITLALVQELKIPWELAEELKRTHVSIGDSEQISQEKEILVRKDDLYKPIKQKLAAEAATGKTKFICSKIKESIEKVVSLNELDSVVVTGRTLLLDGFLELLENNLGIPVKLGKIAYPKLVPLVRNNELLSGHKYLTYLTALGIICQASGAEEEILQPTRINISSRNPISKVISRAKEIYQEYF